MNITSQILQVSSIKKIKLLLLLLQSKKTNLRSQETGRNEHFVNNVNDAIRDCLVG